VIINYNVNENYGVNGAFNIDERSNEAFYASVEGKIRLIFTLDPINLKNIILVATKTTLTSTITTTAITTTSFKIRKFIFTK